MKRFVLPLLVVGIGVVALGVVGYVAVKYLTKPPLSYDDLVKLQDQGEGAAGEIPLIVECLDHNDEVIRAQAAETLSKIGPKSVGPVREKLKSGNANTRFWAAQTLALLGPDAADSAPDLLPLLRDSDPSVRRKAVYALGKTGVKSEQVIGAAVWALNDKDQAVSSTVIEVLDKIDAPPMDSLRALTALAEESTPEVRKAALKLLGKMGEPAVPAFKELLAKGNALPDMEAYLQAIAPLGKNAKGLLPELQEFMIKTVWWDDDLGREVAVRVLIDTFKQCEVDGATGLTTVLKTLHDPKSPHFAPKDGRSKKLVKALGEMGSVAKVAVPTLIELLKERESLRPQILEALGDIGPAANAAIPTVEGLMTDSMLREAARVALRRMGKFEVK